MTCAKALAVGQEESYHVFIGQADFENDCTPTPTYPGKGDRTRDAYRGTVGLPGDRPIRIENRGSVTEPATRIAEGR